MKKQRAVHTLRAGDAVTISVATWPERETFTARVFGFRAPNTPEEWLPTCPGYPCVVCFDLSDDRRRYAQMQPNRVFVVGRFDTPIRVESFERKQ